MAQERRRADRQRTPEGSIVCTSPDFAKPGSPSFNLAMKLLDTSSTGACLVTKGRLRQGVPVFVGIILPRQGTKVMARATVRWSTTVESKGRTAHVAGLQFDRPISALAPRKAPGAPAGQAAKEPQRKHQRFAPEKVDIICLPRGLLTKLGVKANSAKSLKNVSLGGAQIVSSEKLSPGEPVDLTLKFRYPATEVKAEGVVRWCRRDTLSLEPRWNVGVIFKQIDMASQGRLRTVQAVFIDEKSK
jgi:hypothetical protein